MGEYGWKGRLAPVLMATCTLVIAAVWSGGTTSLSAQTQAISVGVLSFRDDSGANLPAELGQRVAQQLRQRLNSSYKDLVTRAIAVPGDSAAGMAVEELISLGKRSGARFVVRGGILDLGSEYSDDEARISLQLYAEVISVETGAVNTARVEGAGIQKHAAAAIRVDATTVSGANFATSALGLALSNSIEQLAPLVYQSVSGQGGQQASSDVTARTAPGDIGSTATSESTTAQEEEELRQLISQAETLLTNPAGISSASLSELDASLKALKDALTTKASQLEKGAGSDEADRDIAARKESLQSVLSRITTEAASTPPASTPVEGQPSGARRNILASIGGFLGETGNILQKIQEIRNTLRASSQDPSQYAAPSSGSDVTQPSTEPVATVGGVVTESGAPVEDVTVTDPESGASATTDSSGSYSLNGVLAGKIAKLVLTKNGKQIGGGQVDVVPGRSGVADFDLKHGTGVGAVSAVSVLPASVVLNSLKLRAGATTGKVQGVVEDEQGKPLARALVELKGLGAARTDSTGRYSFFKVPAGSHQLTIRSVGRADSTTQIDVGANGVPERTIRLAGVEGERVRLPLLLPGGGSVVRGVVRDVDNRPIEGAKVTVLFPGQAISVATGRRGEFEVRGLRPGSYHIIVSKAGLESSSQALELGKGSVEIGDLRLKRAVGLAASLAQVQRFRLGEIKGQVTWSGGEAVAGAMIQIKPLDRSYPFLKTAASSDGKYALKVPEGRYEIKVTYGPQAMSEVVSVGASGSSKEDFRFRRIDFGSVRAATERMGAVRPSGSAQTNGRLTGRVTDASRGTPVPGAIVSIESQTARRTARTDQQGAYSATDLPPDHYRISVTATGFSSADREVVVRTVSEARQDFSLQRHTSGREAASVAEAGRAPARVVEIKKGQITGRVVDAQSARPIVGAVVSGAGPRPVLTDAQGGFLIGDLPPGNYRLRVAIRGFADGDAVVSVHPGQTATAGFRLVAQPGTRLTRP